MSRRNQRNKTSWSEFLLFVSIILCIYFILSLFDSSLTGEGGREWGKYLRNAWGGAVLVPLLFWMYLCIAKLLKFRVPRLPRQILGTIQLYISFAFLLGLLHETGWTSEATLFRAGDFGSGLAKFFVLNVGTFITLLLVIGSFILSAFLFGSRILRVSMPSLPSIPSLNFGNNTTSRTRRTSRKRERESSYSSYRPEKILFTSSLPSPTLKPAPSDYDYDYDDGVQISNSEPIRSAFEIKSKLQMPKLKPAPEELEDYKQPEPERTPVSIIDNLLAKIDAEDLTAPEKQRAKSPSRTRKIRRPLPAVSFPEELQNTNENITLNDNEAEHDEPVFPPPMEIYGPRTKYENTNDNQKSLEKQGKAIISALKNFGVNASVAHIVEGPSVVQYQLELSPGTKASRISGLSEDIAMSLAVISVRVEAPILGTHYVGVEVPNPERKITALRNILESQEFQESTARLPLPLGVQVDGKYLVQGLEEMPHLLIAGGKGSGKSMFLNSCILSMCSRRRPEELKLILIDPRHVEFAVYDGMPHMLAAAVSEPETALRALEWAYNEMESRTENFARVRVRNLAAYNRKLSKDKRLPEIVIVIYELSDLMYSLGNEIESILIRLAQKAGASGIYMILATQRPSADVITTLMKSNIPARAVFTLSSQNDSKNIIGISDADKLTGKGDMLFKNSSFPQSIRLQAPYISEEKVSDFADYMTNNLEHQEFIKF